LGGTAFR